MRNKFSKKKVDCRGEIYYAVNCKWWTEGDSNPRRDRCIAARRHQTRPIPFGLRPACLNPLHWDMRAGVFLPFVRRTGSDAGCWRWFVSGHWHLALSTFTMLIPDHFATVGASNKTY